MARIAIGCDCGRRLTLRAERGGGRIRCPGCGSLLDIPNVAGGAGAEGASVAPSVSATGSTCAVCQTMVEADEAAVGCPECETPYHSECWQEYGGCATYGCQRAPKQQAKETEPTKECPFCAETIPAKVLRCPSCRERFEDARPVDREDYIDGLINEPKLKRFRQKCLGFLAVSIIPCLGPVALVAGVLWLQNGGDDFERAGPIYRVTVGAAATIGATHSLLLLLTLVAVLL